MSRPISELAEAWEEIRAFRRLRRFPMCSCRCARHGSYVCRRCGRPFCGHCAGHKIAVDDERHPIEQRATCVCTSCQT